MIQKRLIVVHSEECHKHSGKLSLAPGRVPPPLCTLVKQHRGPLIAFATEKVLTGILLRGQLFLPPSTFFEIYTDS